MTQKIVFIPIGKIKTNAKNPRTIRDEKFKSLVKSIKDFPEMLEIRPIVLNKEMMPIGGSQRHKAAKEAGLKKVPCIIADNLTPEQEKEFMIRDNAASGEWNFEELTKGWDINLVEDWGVSVPNFAPDVDYSILEDDDVKDQLSGMTSGVKKAIQIEFESEHYEEAYALVKFWRDRGAYVGSMIIEYLKAEKDRI